MHLRPRFVLVLALLVTLGAARDADLAAHVFGFVAGGVVGFVAGVALRQRQAPRIQWILGALAAVTVVLCWRLALRN